MKLFRKIKNIKRHKRNKCLRNLADGIFTAARYGDEMIVSSKIYNIIYFRNSHVPSNIKEFGGMKNDMTIMTVPKEVMNFYSDESLRYEEWFGLMHQEPSEECKKQLSDIPLSQFVYPEVFAPKLDAIKPKLGE
jgi:hypothetical protein